jgi:hypothetical protein
VAIESLTGEGDFGPPPDRGALDAARRDLGRGGGGLLRISASRHFRSNHNTATPSGFANEIVPFNPKQIVLEAFGPPGTVATINYLDVNAQPQHADDVTLPWSYDTTTTHGRVPQRDGTRQ